MTSYKSIILTRKEKLLIITLNRPKRKNAFDVNMYCEVTKAINDAAKDDSVLITAITGHGDFYSSGNDLNNFTAAIESGDLEKKLKDSSMMLQDLFDAFINFPKILVAVVNGPCIGIAATTAALCDVVYASDEAYFLTPFTQMALNPEGCSSYTFPKILGTSKANEMLLLNQKLSSADAFNFGFVSEIFNNSSINKIWSKLEELSKLPPQSVIQSKKLIKKFDIEQLHLAKRSEIELLDQRKISEEAMEAVMKFFARKSKL